MFPEKFDTFIGPASPIQQNGKIVSKGETKNRIKLISDESDNKYAIAGENITNSKNNVINFIKKHVLAHWFVEIELGEGKNKQTLLLNKNSLCKRIGIPKDELSKQISESKNNLGEIGKFILRQINDKQQGLVPSAPPEDHLDSLTLSYESEQEYQLATYALKQQASKIKEQVPAECRVRKDAFQQSLFGRVKYTIPQEAFASLDQLMTQNLVISYEIVHGYHFPQINFTLLQANFLSFKEYLNVNSGEMIKVIETRQCALTQSNQLEVRLTFEQSGLILGHFEQSLGNQDDRDATKALLETMADISTVK